MHDPRPRFAVCPAKAFLVVLVLLLIPGLGLCQEPPLILRAGAPALMADLDGDHKPDRILLTRSTAVQLDLTRERRQIHLGGPDATREAVLALVDYDHDFDLDLILAVPGRLLGVHVWINELGRFHAYCSPGGDSLTADVRPRSFPETSHACLPSTKRFFDTIAIARRATAVSTTASHTLTCDHAAHLASLDPSGTSRSRAPPARA